MKIIRLAIVVLATFFANSVHTAPIVIDLVFSVTNSPGSSSDSSLETGTLTGGLTIDDSLLASAGGSNEIILRGPSTSFSELLSFQLTGSGFVLPGAASNFTYDLTDLTDLNLGIFNNIDLTQDLVGQSTGIVAPGGELPSFNLTFANIGSQDLSQLSAAVTTAGVLIGAEGVYPSFPTSGSGFSDISFSNFPVETPSSAPTFDFVRFELTSAIVQPSAVPVPAAVWLFGSGLLGLLGIARRKRAVD